MKTLKELRHELYVFRQDFFDVFTAPKYSVSKLIYDEYNKLFLGTSKVTRFQRKRLDVLLGSMNVKIQSHLDFGAGNCAISLALRSSLGIGKSAAIDLGDFTKSICQDNNISYYSSTMELDGSYDLVTAFEVLEHISDPEIVAMDLFERAEKYFVFTVPNTGFWKYRMRLLFGKFPNQWKLHQSEHLRFWTVTDMEQWIKTVFPDHNTSVTPYYNAFGVKFLPRLFCRGIFVSVIRKNGKN